MGTVEDGDKFDRHGPVPVQLSMIHPCDGRPDRQAIAYSALSMYAVCCRALIMTNFETKQND